MNFIQAHITIGKEKKGLKLRLSEKDLESALKDDLLKIKYPELRKKKW